MLKKKKCFGVLGETIVLKLLIPPTSSNHGEHGKFLLNFEPGHRTLLAGRQDLPGLCRVSLPLCTTDAFEATQHGESSGECKGKGSQSCGE